MLREIFLGKNNFIHNLASLNGKITTGENVSVWPGASLRGDEAEIIIGNNSNIQDNATIHSDRGNITKIGKNVTIGHNAIVHGATICDNVIIGMGAIVLDGAIVNSNCIIGAGALISSGKIIPENSVVIGNPYKILREIKDSEKEHILINATEYMALAKEYSKISK